MNTRKYKIGKLLEAIAISGVLIGLVMGFRGDEWGELYFFLGGIALFLIGRRIEKRSIAAPPPADRTNVSANEQYNQR